MWSIPRNEPVKFPGTKLQWMGHVNNTEAGLSMMSVYTEPPHAPFHLPFHTLVKSGQNAKMHGDPNM